MYSPEFADCHLVFAFLDNRSNIQAGAADANDFAKAPLKAWFDLIQGG